MTTDRSPALQDFISRPLYDVKTLLSRDSNYARISIVIPSYNKGEFIEKTILSVLNQNYPHMELIIIDGGSSDRTLEVIKKYESFIDYWVSETDSGQSEALNKGFTHATGQIVNEMDADDIFLPDAFQKISELYIKYPNADIIFGNRLDIDKHDQIIGEIKYTRFSPIVYRYDGMCIGPQSAFWKRDLFQKIGMYDPALHLAMDYEFFMKATVSGARFQYVPYCFSAMRRYEGSKTSQFLNTAPHQKEWDLINARYGKIGCFKKLLKLYTLAYRTFWYFLQGDGRYVLRGLKRRACT